MDPDAPAQPSWSMAFDDSSAADGPPPSRFVELTMTLRLEVTDPAALRAAAGGEVADLSSCVGMLVRATRLLADLPGTVPTGSATSAGYWDPSAG